MGVAGRGPGALRVIEHNGAGAIGVVDDAARAWGLSPALPGHLRHVHTPLPEVSHQETWDGARAKGRARRHQLEPRRGLDLPRGWGGAGARACWVPLQEKALFCEFSDGGGSWRGADGVQTCGHVGSCGCHWSR